MSDNGPLNVLTGRHTKKTSKRKQLKERVPRHYNLLVSRTLPLKSSVPQKALKPCFFVLKSAAAARATATNSPHSYHSTLLICNFNRQFRTAGLPAAKDNLDNPRIAQASAMVID